MTRRRPPRPDDRGITLPELLVTVFLLGIVMTMIVSFMTAVSRTYTLDTSATDSTNIAANSMNELTRVIRSGTEVRLPTVTATPVFVSATANEVTLYAYIDTSSATPAPIKVRFSIDAQRRLIETRWEATSAGSPWTFASTPTTVRTIGRAVPAGAPDLFTYYKADSLTPFVPAAGTFTTAELKEIAAVSIHLTIQADVTDRAEPVELKNTVAIPNLGISRIGLPT